MELIIPLWMKIVSCVGDAYISQIAKKTGATFSAVSSITKLLAKKKIVVCVLKGRTNYVFLTERGKELQKQIKFIMQYNT